MRSGQFANDLAYIRSELRKYYLSEGRIAQEAYYIWEREGHPNGEENRLLGPFNMRVRDIHWLQAKARLEAKVEVEAKVYLFLSRSSRETQTKCLDQKYDNDRKSF